LRRSILACGLLLAFAGMATAATAARATKISQGTPSTMTSTTTSTTVATTGARHPAGVSRRELRTAARWRRHIRRFRADTRHWLTVMRGRPPANGSRMLAAHSLPRLRQLNRRWQHRAHRAWLQATHPPRLQDFLCIHRYEGSWADSGSPYYGGLQMDLSFQQTYGGWLLSHKGTADHWSPLEQIWAAERATRSRGFSPWPSTARDCGLY
jgi:Transglycosylase-like domain